MARKNTYSLRLIRRNYTYTVYEVAELFKLTPDTVFRWIRCEGLKRIVGSKKYFVHSSDLNIFLTQKNSKHKKPCSDGEIYCCKCRGPKRPNEASLISKKMPNKTIRVTATCESCNTQLNTFVSATKWSPLHPFYLNRNASTNQHSGEHEILRKYQTRIEALR